MALCLVLFLIVIAMCITIAVLHDPAENTADPGSEASLSNLRTTDEVSGEEPANTEEAETAAAPSVSNRRLRDNVIISGVNVGGMRGPEAVEAVSQAAQAAFAEPVSLVLPDRTTELRADLLQATIDATAAVAQAQNWQGDETTPLVLPGEVIANTGYIRAQLEILADQIATEPTAPTVVYSENWLFITIGEPGVSLDVDGAFQAIMNALALMQTQVSCDYTLVPADPVDMQALYDQYCTTPVNAFYDESAGEIVRGQVGYQFDVDAAQAQIDATPAGQTTVVQLVETNPEITYSYLASLGSMAELAAFSREAMGENAPEPATYEDFPDVLGQFSTEYSNNPSRTNNLIRACETLNGTILEPGELFSFNGTVGERTAEKGYKEAVAYVGGENVDEIGGGVCQVATTIYNAVLLANLQVDTRYAHMYEPHYCEPGLDATVSWSQPDFKFINNTSKPLLIEANVSGGYVNIRLMGIKENDYNVVMTTEIMGNVDYYQTVYRADSSLSLNESAVYQGGSNGYTIRSFRNVYDSAGNLISSTLESYSNYTRRDRVVLVSPNSPYLW